MEEQENLNIEQVPEELKVKLAEIKTTIEENIQRVAKLGKWPEYIKPDSLLERIPQSSEKDAPGFDAGIACALNLIPEDKQELTAELHANYTREAVLQVRQELMNMNADSATSWWLAACSLCKEGQVNVEQFLQQIEDFKNLIINKIARLEAAKKEYETMTSGFKLVDGVPFGEKDGCIQGAYIAGYPFGSMYASKYGLYFVGTYEDSLGLEDFKWSEEKDARGRPKSGPVFGSKQFVKCSNEEEWKLVIEIVKKKFKEEIPNDTNILK